MRILSLLIILTALISSCSQKHKPINASIDIPSAPEDRSKPLALNSAKAHIKSIDNKKITGLFYFSQTNSHAKLEAQAEGLRAGPYGLYISDSKNCKKMKVDTTKDLGQVIADKNGVVKEALELTKIQVYDLVGKSIVLHAKSKRFPEVVACGVIEKL